MGSGTVGVGCAYTNRDVLGIEIDEFYFSIAEKRIDDAFQEIAESYWEGE